MKFLIWTLSKICHSFIKIKDSAEKKEDDNDFSQNLLKSKILSGGLQNRFLSTFSKETIQTIENLATITGDKQLHKYLTEVEMIDEDEVYLSIINEGKDEGVDRLINLLQWNLLKRNPMAKAGGPEGMTLSRCAFAGMLALNQFEEQCSYTNFVMMVDHLEMSLDMIDETANQNQKNMELMKELQSMGSIKPILDRWEMASKMRIWLQEKRKDISNSIKKKADAEQRRREEEIKLLEEAKKHVEEAKDDEEEVIDTTGKGNKESKVEPISQEELLRREQEQIVVLVRRVMDKAELLVKLATPPSWEQPDSSKENFIAIDGYKMDNNFKDNDLASKLKKIKTIQESKGTITSYENLSNKDIFNSCASSVLATLQCTVSAKNMMKAIEAKYISAMNRYCGLKIMGELSSCYMNDDTKISCFNWFCSALRHNTNILSHYSDDLNGMGEYLLDKCRISFFDVYNGIVRQLKDTTDESTIEFLLNCLEWKIGATDHQYILKSGIIQTLKDGNMNEDRAKNPIKYW